jgi:GNAT superfamily N-acetyltransferase
LVATSHRDGREEIIGVGRYARLDDASSPVPRAEVAFAVADAYQGRGIATLLLEELASIARAAGVEEFEADVLGENNRCWRCSRAAATR